jgi:competence protein ComEC
MFQWVPYAFVRIVFFFIAGILTGIYWPLLDEYHAGISLMVLVGLYFFLTRWSKINPGAVGLLAVFMAGYCNLLFKSESRDASHFLQVQNSIAAYKAELTEPAEEKTGSWKAIARITAVADETGVWQRVSGRVLLYFSKADFTRPYRYGDVLLIHGAPVAIAPPANPGEFDYKKFLGYRNIYHQHYLRRNAVLHFDSTGGNRIARYAYQVREQATKVFAAHLDGQQQQAIALALILGVKEGLDNELTQAYAASGAMHVLAVSGLHVGIMYMVMLVVLKPLTRTQKGKWVLAFISIVMLWGYALITGFSPSVLRAVTMFSFVALARPLNYRTNIYNILAVSAFVLLLANPYLIMSVGFQLSFMAVLGIVYLQPGLYRVWNPKNLILDKVWQITCVSLAAQLATFALGILYFYQFPVYFLFSNLFVIPGATIILIGGILLLAVSPVTEIANLVGMVLTWLIETINAIVFTVEQMPFSLLEPLYISTPQCWLLIFIILFGILLLRNRKFYFAVAAAFAAFAFGAIQWHRHLNEIKPAKVVVYNIAGASAVEFTCNGKSRFFGDPTLITNPERIRFHVRPNRMISGIYHTTVNDSSVVKPLTANTAVCWWLENLVVFMRGPSAIPKNLSIDYLIVSNNAVSSANDLATIKAKVIILDSSNSPRITDRLLAEAKLFSLPLYSVRHSGAYVNRLSL